MPIYHNKSEVGRPVFSDVFASIDCLENVFQQAVRLASNKAVLHEALLEKVGSIRDLHLLRQPSHQPRPKRHRAQQQ